MWFKRKATTAHISLLKFEKLKKAFDEISMQYFKKLLFLSDFSSFCSQKKSKFALRCEMPLIFSVTSPSLLVPCLWLFLMLTQRTK